MSSAESERNEWRAVERYTRIDADPWGIRVQACVVTWPMPGRPENRWVTVGLLAPDVGDAVVERTRKRFLRDQRLFRTCAECAESVPVGLLDADGVCADCASDRRAAAGGE